MWFSVGQRTDSHAAPILHTITLAQPEFDDAGAPTMQVDNGIPIESWFDDRGDTELLKLIRFLDPLQTAPDVRPLVRDRFRVWKLVSDATLPPPASSY